MKSRIEVKRYKDLDTGEIITTPVVDNRIEEEDKGPKDTGWDKIWTAHIMTIVDEIGTKKMKVVSWLIEHRDKRNNMILATQDEISEGAEVSRPTVVRTLQALRNCDILTMKKGGGIYRLNPKLIFFGSAEKRQNIMYRYIEERAEEEYSQRSGDMVVNDKEPQMA